MKMFNLGMVLAASGDKVANKINEATTIIQITLSAVVVGVGICVSLFYVITKMASLADPHEKVQFWKTQGWIMGAMAFAGVIIWLVPWVYSLFR
ncbi:CagC family type IV secretion system protein [Bacillus atrophaeus]|uniref:CagC family type IV secretion system protein n=1 Tax=Bacillus atrophaeus TaxID=1452 RepID=UPI002280D259|nr:CagC family type IV secretion system protein [Bacillus atrophaeus]MCY8497752.1 CagC family type IV secretion system protein [Bacillus atrophaeus]MCY8814943.1 CagC family type IV secretion system protein [Bacillus atrophaeus]MCY8821555.1 CagC family type IV secretion system protein [Bacillus atrophaeus]MCY8830985.1 CagC family type IV secretion system protein [Bacillus atrophaeus]MCY8835244.1 CagC family type IV secretion system protein [Bacillus atrophaeus]